MVRESQCAAVLVEFAAAAGPGGGRVDGIDASGEQMVDRLVAGGRRERVLFGELPEEIGGAGGGGVEVAAEQQGVSAGPGRGVRGGAQYFLGGARRVAHGGVEVGDAQSGGGAGKCHDAAL